jgi:hypothetical protein
MRSKLKLFDEKIEGELDLKAIDFIGVYQVQNRR